MNRSLMITIAGVVVVMLLLRASFMSVLQVLIIVGVLAAFAYWKDISGWFKHSVNSRPAAPKVHQPSKMDKLAAEVFSLTLEDARKRAMPLIDKVYKIEQARVSKQIERLGSSLQQLFAASPILKAKRGDAGLNGAEVKPYVWPGATAMAWGTQSRPHDGYLQIGKDFSGCAIVAWPEEDEIHIVRRSPVAIEKCWLASYPSVYHWLLMEHPDA